MRRVVCSRSFRLPLSSLRRLASLMRSKGQGGNPPPARHGAPPTPIDIDNEDEVANRCPSFHVFERIGEYA
eukprot:5993516-Alexandrium_andersonii.AAC.1